MSESYPAKSIIGLSEVTLTLPSLAGEVNILRGISLDVAPGEAVGLVGPSGSGKSTLLMVLAGLESPTGGKVEVAGNDLTRLDEDGLARYRRDHVGIVFQSFHLVPTMTSLENVAVPLELAGRKDAFARAEEELKHVGLGHRLDHYPGQLSGGEQQRVALARAVAGDPEILMADEPTGNLDAKTGAQIIELMFDLHRRRGTTLVLITHDNELAEMCDRVVRLKDGQVEAVHEGRQKAAAQ
ncbi:ABC transporter ATP-binding protein [Tepidicaulis sp. LMO-SS28]|uniref:ABC transporter ATP-binding protein n=1 Tax=Tepidicaulis sp. LMO-SS28 TaxID=3447455 RepID=UPI003EE15E77